jgi:hypothetical protein
MRSSRGASLRGRGRRAVQPSAQLGGPRSNAGSRGGRFRGNDISSDHVRRMEHVASVSRSSGLEKDGDS